MAEKLMDRDEVDAYMLKGRREQRKPKVLTPEEIEAARISARNKAAAMRRENVQDVIAPENVWQRLARILGGG